MKALAIIERCKAQGVELRTETTLNGEQLYAEPAGKLTFDLVEQIQKNKEELITVVKNLLDRTAKYKQALKWLDVKAIELQITTNDPAHDFMVEALDSKYNHLNDAWCAASDEDFLQALREYATAGAQALREEAA